MLTERFEEALLYAIRLHATQRRKASDVPFVAHLFSVTASVLEDGGSEDEAIAALLHDAVEDQGGPATRQGIVSKFGQTVPDIIDGCRLACWSGIDGAPNSSWQDHGSARLMSKGDGRTRSRSVPFGVPIKYRLSGRCRIYRHSKLLPALFS